MNIHICPMKNCIIKNIKNIHYKRKRETQKTTTRRKKKRQEESKRKKESINTENKY